MSSRKRKQQNGRGIFEQVLNEDYWEGYYALTDGSIVKLSDPDGSNVSFAVFNIKTGRKTAEDTVPYNETTVFENLASAISKTTGSRIYLRISNEAENPDRQYEIDQILESGDKFQLMRIRNLVDHLSNRGINILGGKVGGQDLYEGGFGGFYLLGDRKVMLCNNLNDWDDSMIDRIVDGVIAYRIFDADRFGMSASPEEFFGFLEGEKFSEFASILAEEHGKSITKIAEEGTELYRHLVSALNGDAESAAIASHKLKINLCVKV